MAGGIHLPVPPFFIANSGVTFSETELLSGYTVWMEPAILTYVIFEE